MAKIRQNCQNEPENKPENVYKNNKKCPQTGTFSIWWTYRNFIQTPFYRYGSLKKVSIHLKLVAIQIIRTKYQTRQLQIIYHQNAKMSMVRLKYIVFAKSRKPYRIWKFKWYVRGINLATPYIYVPTVPMPAESFMKDCICSPVKE